MKKMNKKGFTLMEMLIVVAIIAVLVAISIPVFSAQLEKAREATDAANIRAAYAEVSTNAILGDTSTSVTVNEKQKVAGWENTEITFPTNIQGTVPDPTGSGSWTVSWDGTNGKVKVTHS